MLVGATLCGRPEVSPAPGYGFTRRDGSQPSAVQASSGGNYPVGALHEAPAVGNSAAVRISRRADSIRPVLPPGGKLSAKPTDEGSIRVDLIIEAASDPPLIRHLPRGGSANATFPQGGRTIRAPLGAERSIRKAGERARATTENSERPPRPGRPGRRFRLPPRLRLPPRPGPPPRCCWPWRCCWAAAAPPRPPARSRTRPPPPRPRMKLLPPPQGFWPTISRNISPRLTSMLLFQPPHPPPGRNPRSACSPPPSRNSPRSCPGRRTTTCW